MASSGTEIKEKFQEYFNIAIATKPEQKDDVFSIRYRVYCQEFGWEDKSAFPDEKEHDEFDEQSLHCLITHKPTGIPAACVRLVLTDIAHSSELLPFEKYCQESLDQTFMKQPNLSRNTFCEVSRLAISREFRKRNKESESRYGPIRQDFTLEEQRAFPLLPVAAFLFVGTLAHQIDRQNIFCVMEPFLPRILKLFGLPVQRVGDNVEYHGTRAVHFANTQSGLENLGDELFPIYEMIKSEIDHANQSLA